MLALRLRCAPLRVTVLALLVVAPLEVRAQAELPVHLESCGMITSQFYAGNAAHIASAFVNVGKTTADWIDFSVWWADGSVDTVHDVGTFAPGKAIKHTWYIGMGVRAVGPALWYYVYAYPSRVHYTDGTEWVSPYEQLFGDEQFEKEKPLSTRCKIYPI